MNVIKTQYLRGLDLQSEAQVIESVSGGTNGGCNLYIGESALSDSYITVKNISGDEVTFHNPSQGVVLPFSITEIVAIGNVSKLVALW